MGSIGDRIGRRRTDARPFDLPSTTLFLASVLPVVYGLKQVADGNPSWSAGAAVGASVIAALLFVRRQLHIADPLLDLRSLTDRTAGTALLLLLLGPAVVGGITMFVPQYLQLVHGLDALHAGALVTPAALGLVVGALIAPAAARRLAAGTVIAIGLLVACSGFLPLGHGVTLGPAWTVVGLIVVYVGSGPFDALGTDLVIGAAPQDEAGSAGAASETMAELGTGLGIAGLGTLGTSVYQHRFGAELDVTVPDVVTAGAGESISRAAAATERLTERQADAVLDAAATAFSAGVQAAAITAAGIVAALTVVTIALLRR